MSSDLIKGKVARVLNSREIAINAGNTQGVSDGMLFDILDPKGENITDPDTGEILGSVKRPKVRVKVSQVEENFSIAETYKKKRINVGGSGLAMSSLTRALESPKYVTKHETLKTSEKTWEDLDEEESFVKTGDPVIEVRAGREEDS